MLRPVDKAPFGEEEYATEGLLHMGFGAKAGERHEGTKYGYPLTSSISSHSMPYGNTRWTTLLTHKVMQVALDWHSKSSSDDTKSTWPHSSLILWWVPHPHKEHKRISLRRRTFYCRKDWIVRRSCM
jgi:hypothetical protein